MTKTRGFVLVLAVAGMFILAAAVKHRALLEKAMRRFHADPAGAAQLAAGRIAGFIPKGHAAVLRSGVKAPARLPSRYGVNLGNLRSWSNERAFMNLLAGAHWQDVNHGWNDFPEKAVDRNGNLILVGATNAASAMTMPPRARTADVAVRCTYRGEGVLSIFEGKSIRQSDHAISFTWAKGSFPAFISGFNAPGNPVRDIDCREADADPRTLFDPAFVTTLRPYAAVRFLDWQGANGNGSGDWSRRTLPSAMTQADGDGVAVEHLVALANQAQVNPWFTMPFNADATYTENFARYVHDHLDPRLTAYVEVGNEVWNFSFQSAQQALGEARTRGWTGNLDEGRMRAYAEHATAAFKIWAGVYRDNPGRLVRVLAGQAVWPELLGYALDWQDTADQVDAIAFAPYFGMDFLSQPGLDTADTDALFGKLGGVVDAAIATVRRDKAFADRYGKRMLAYEAGQHITNGTPDQTVIARLNRDPRMRDVYRRYLEGWEREAGDLMMMFASVSQLHPGAAWGLAEYSGQPLAQTPKRQAVMDAITRVRQRPGGPAPQ